MLLSQAKATNLYISSVVGLADTPTADVSASRERSVKGEAH